MTDTATWTGQSGRSYTYEVYSLGTAFNDLPGNYVYAARSIGIGWTAAYIGQTASLRDRLADHEKEACGRRNGATHIHVHVNRAGEQARLTQEADLIAKHRPACNAVGLGLAAGFMR